MSLEEIRLLLEETQHEIFFYLLSYHHKTILMQEQQFGKCKEIQTFASNFHLSMTCIPFQTMAVKSWAGLDKFHVDNRCLIYLSSRKYYFDQVQTLENATILRKENARLSENVVVKTFLIHSNHSRLVPNSELTGSVH